MQNTDESEAVRRKAAEASRLMHAAGGATSSTRSPFVWGLALLFIVGIVIVVLMTRGPQRATRHSR